MNFNEFKQKVDLLNLLNMQKRKTEKDIREIAILNIELKKYEKFFDVSNSTFQNHLKDHFNSLGKNVKFITESKTKNGYTTIDYIISVFGEKSTISPEKRYTYQSKTFPTDKPVSSNFNLMLDLFASPIKSSLFDETPGMKDLYWKMVEENFREQYKFKFQRQINPKTGKFEKTKFDKNKTDVSVFAKTNTSSTNNESVSRTI